MQRVILFCLLLIACGVDKEADNNNHGLGYNYDAIGASGLRVRYEPGLENLPNLLPPEKALAWLETLYIQTEDCANIKVPGPLIIAVPVGVIGRINTSTEPHGDDGYVFADTLTILLQDPVTQSLFRFNWLARHDSVHYLLAMSGFPKSRNMAHDSTLFTICVY